MARQSPPSTSTVNTFGQFVLDNFHLLLESPHFLFDDQSPAMLEQYHQSLTTLQKDLSQGVKKFVLHNPYLLEDPEDPFHLMRVSRIQKFPNAFESPIPGESSWYCVLSWSSSTFLHSTLRRVYNLYYSWGVISSSAIEVIKKYSPILEIGAGNGYWAYELHRHNIDIIATDTHADLVDDLAPLCPPWFFVEKLDAKEAIRTHKGRTILMVWPHGYALDAVEQAEEAGATTLIIVGDRSRRLLTSSITDDPFGGVNKGEDSDMMSHVRRVMVGQEGSSTRFEEDMLAKIATRYNNGTSGGDKHTVNPLARERWELIETSPIPNFVTTDDGEAICDFLFVYRLKGVKLSKERVI